MSTTTIEILSVSNTYTNGTTLPVSQLEQGGTKVLVIKKIQYNTSVCRIRSSGILIKGKDNFDFGINV